MRRQDAAATNHPWHALRQMPVCLALWIPPVKPMQAFRPVGLVIFTCAALHAAAQAQADPSLAEVSVSSSQETQRRFDAASSHTAVAVDAIEAATPLVNLSELLADQAGVVVRNRGNYAQDLQISIRGFGTRSTFGVRGVRLLVDGIPASMPDGQGQAATAQLASAAEVEVLRGPFAQLYGNAAGGVLHVRTREPRPGGGAAAQAAIGSNGERLLGASLDVGSAELGGLIDVVKFETGGWRAHSAAERVHLNSKWVARPGRDTRITTLVNLYDQARAQDPLGLTRAQWDADPRQVQPLAERFNTRKAVAQNQLGVVLEHKLGAQDALHAQVYGGTRSLEQSLAFAGTGPTSAGGVVDVSRRYGGAGVSWTHQTRLPSGLPLAWTLGASADRLMDARRGFVNDSGVAGALKRDQTDRAGSTDAYAQLDSWVTERLRLVAGARFTRVRLAVDDHYIRTGNPNDSGSKTFSRTSPVLGLVWGASEALNVYANLGSGFESPTLSELAYSPTGSGANFALRAARTRQMELGGKWRAGPQRWSAAVFDARTSGEIVPTANLGGRTMYGNAANVRRRGVELAWQTDIGQRGTWTPRAALTWLDAFYERSDGKTPADVPGASGDLGGRLPGAARSVLHLALDHRPAAGWRWGVQAHASSTLRVSDQSAETAPGYATLGLHASRSFDAAGARWNAWARIDNLLDRHYAGSVIVNEGNGRYYEPASGRRLVVGLRAQFR